MRLQTKRSLCKDLESIALICCRGAPAAGSPPPNRAHTENITEAPHVACLRKRTRPRRAGMRPGSTSAREAHAWRGTISGDGIKTSAQVCFNTRPRGSALLNRLARHCFLTLAPPSNTQAGSADPGIHAPRMRSQLATFERAGRESWPPSRELCRLRESSTFERALSPRLFSFLHD